MLTRPAAWAPSICDLLPLGLDDRLGQRPVAGLELVPGGEPDDLGTGGVVVDEGTGVGGQVVGVEGNHLDEFGGEGGAAREVATAVEFLLSDDASYIPGAHPAVDGGFLA